jgi:putative flippase GtrA
MSDIAKRPSRTPRRVRRKRAEQLVFVGGGAALVAVVGFLLAVLTAFPNIVWVLAAIVAGVCFFMFKRSVKP